MSFEVIDIDKTIDNCTRCEVRLIPSMWNEKELREYTLKIPELNHVKDGFLSSLCLNCGIVYLVHCKIRD